MPDPMFPSLDEAQIARLAPYGHYRRIAAGEILFDQGDVKRGFYVLIEGRLEIVSPSPQGETLLRVHEGGEFTGELDMLTGRRSLVRVRAAADSRLLEIDIAGLRHIVQTDAELSEIFLQAFLLRHAYLVANTPGDVVLIGSSHSADTLRLNAFLTRNGHPHTYLDAERDSGIQALLDQFQFRMDEIPVLICRGKQLLRNPSNAEAAVSPG